MTADQPEPANAATSRAAVDRPEPLMAAGFKVQIDGLADAAAIEVVLPEGRITGVRVERAVQYGPLTLRRALGGSPDWYLWWDGARKSLRGDAGRAVRVTLIDRSGVEAAAWTFARAQPIAYSLSPLNALASTPVVETLELAVDGFEAAFDALSPRTRDAGR
jgi:hypothetical protein